MSQLHRGLLYATERARFTAPFVDLGLVAKLGDEPG